MEYVFVDLINNNVINPKTNKPYVLKDVPKGLQSKVKQLLKANEETNLE